MLPHITEPSGSLGLRVITLYDAMHSSLFISHFVRKLSSLSCGEFVYNVNM